MKDREKQYEKLPSGYKKLIIDALEKIQSGNRTTLDIKSLGTDQYRCRIGKYRLLFSKTPTGIIINTLGSRGDVYK